MLIPDIALCSNMLTCHSYGDNNDGNGNNDGGDTSNNFMVVRTIIKCLCLSDLA